MLRYDRDEVQCTCIYITVIIPECSSVCYDFMCKLSEQTIKYLSPKNLELEDLISLYSYNALIQTI